MEKRWLWVVLGVALVLRLGWGLTRAGEIGKDLPDQGEYLELGRNLLHEGELKFYDGRFGQEVWAYRTPGYPAFIALMGGSTRGVRAGQAVVDTLTCLAAYLLARRWLGEKQAVVAAGLVAVNPLLVYFSGLILSETLFTALIAWGFVCCAADRGWGKIVLGMVLLLGAVAVRPSGIGLVVAGGVLGVWVNRGGGGAYVWQRAAVAGVIGTALLAGAGALWAWRNHERVGAWVWTTTNEGVTRYDGYNERANGGSNQWFVKEMPRLRDMDEVQRDRLFSDLSAQYMDEHPERVWELIAKKAGRTWSPVPLSKEFGTSRYMAVGLGYTVPFFLLTLAGLGWGRLPRAAKVMMLTPAVWFTIVHALSVGSLRYRVPVEPELAVIAASVVGVGGTEEREPGEAEGGERV